MPGTIITNGEVFNFGDLVVRDGVDAELASPYFSFLGFITLYNAGKPVPRVSKLGFSVGFGSLADVSKI